MAAACGKYIVVFKPTTSQEEVDKFAQTVHDDGGEVTHHYGSLLKGFAAKLTSKTLQQFSFNDVIDYIQPDGIVGIN
ncbi:hypothetical protein B0H10DRAFT_2222891 [Mycena sp. CBHHK59/15]|nr:hypothetical protein B0H10DRAFT_2222891 [Mycena sp. CBHHK59/15]